MKIQELLQLGAKQLAPIEDHNLIAKLVLAYCLNQEKQYVMLHGEKEVREEVAKAYKDSIQKIASGYPMQYVTHTQEFMKLNFYVNEHVLIPRPDTEILVEEILKLVSKEEKVRILDLCTGSGAIGISLANYLPKANVDLVDISEEALEVAQRNARSNQLEDRIMCIQSNMFHSLSEGGYDVIVSNPPYVETKVVRQLEPQVKNQPVIALDGGEDGLAFYQILTEKSYRFLKQDGILGLEIGYDQKEKVMKLLQTNHEYKDIVCKQDLGGNDRVILARRR